MDPQGLARYNVLSNVTPNSPAAAILLSVILLLPMFRCHGGIFLTQDIVDNDSIAYAMNFPQVGAIYVLRDDGYVRGSGTVALHDDIVITAAHLFDGVDGHGGGINSVLFYMGSNVYSATQSAYGTDWVVNPDYASNGENFGPNDIAVLHLDRPMVGITPASLYTGELTIGMPLSMVGVGLTGTTATGYVPFDGYERAGTNIIDAFSIPGNPFSVWGPNFIFADFDNRFDLTPLEWLAAPGDSGGGWFANDGSLAAVSSFLTYLGSAPQVGTHTAAVRLDSYQTWLNDTIEALTVPEASTLALASTACLMGIFASCLRCKHIHFGFLIEVLARYSWYRRWNI